MVTAASARPGRIEGIEVYDLDPPLTAPSTNTHAALVVRGIEHGDTSYEVRIFFNAPSADDQTPRTADAGYGGHVSVSGHGHHLGDDEHRPRLPIDVTIDVTDAFRRAVETSDGVNSVTLVPIADDAVTNALWRFSEFELRTHHEPMHASAHIVDEFGSVADA